MTDRGSCEAVEALLPEHALGVLTGADAAEVADHTARCASCRARLAALSGAADSVLLLAPEREPSAAFTGQVVAALGSTPSGRRVARPWRRALAIAAAVLLLLGVGAVIGRATGSPSGTSAPAAARDLDERPMTGAGGRAAGHVLLYRGEPSMAVVSLDYGAMPAGEYSVAATDGTDATARTVGRVTVDGSGRGSWGGSVGDGALRSVRVVDDAGHVLCEARFDVAQSPDGPRS